MIEWKIICIYIIDYAEDCIGLLELWEGQKYWLQNMVKYLPI